jgi:glycosyltransferase involved in cell wall biosynthesis
VQSKRFDVIHNHAYLWDLPLRPIISCPALSTIHITPTEDHARIWSRTPEAAVSAISDFQWSEYPDLEPIGVVRHGLDAADFAFVAEPADYLCFLGRFIPGKGPLGAIQVARQLDLPLRLAGPVNDYYRNQIAPLVDGSKVQYAGYVTGAARNELLGCARVLLYPVRSPEPFGLVLLEAMLCGTPVAGLRKGAGPEVVEEGVTGYLVDDISELGAAVLRAAALDRRQVRSRTIARFSSTRMAAEYAALYETLVRQTHPCRT